MAMNTGPASSRRSRRAPMAEINVTPFVDVMLVLLIIFMVTAPLMTSGVEVNLPESKAEALSQEQEPVSITIDTGGAVFVNDEQLEPGALGVRLQQVAAGSDEQGGPRIYLRADQSLDYGAVIAVMGELNRAGLRRVALVSTVQQEAR